MNTDIVAKDCNCDPTQLIGVEGRIRVDFSDGMYFEFSGTIVKAEKIKGNDYKVRIKPRNVVDCVSNHVMSSILR